MKFLEKDLELIIWESDNEKLNEKGLPISGKKLRQFKIGNYGIADLITYEKKHLFGYPFLEITVYELKKEKVGISAFLQAVRYCKGISTYFKDNRPNIDFKLKIILCAKEVDKQSDYIFLTDLIFTDDNGYISKLENYSFDYGIDGIEFKKERGYDLIQKGF
jgi:hypothetical protein